MKHWSIICRRLEKSNVTFIKKSTHGRHLMIKVYQYTKLSSFLASHDIQQTFYSLSRTQCWISSKIEDIFFVILWRRLLNKSHHYLAYSSVVVQKLLLNNVFTHSTTAPKADKTILCDLRHFMITCLFHPLFDVILLMKIYQLIFMSLPILVVIILIK